MAGAGVMIGCAVPTAMLAGGCAVCIAFWLAAPDWTQASASAQQAAASGWARQGPAFFGCRSGQERQRLFQHPGETLEKGDRSFGGQRIGIDAQQNGKPFASACGHQPEGTSRQ